MPLSSSNLHKDVEMQSRSKDSVPAQYVIEKGQPKPKSGKPPQHPVRLIKGSTTEHGYMLN